MEPPTVEFDTVQEQAIFSASATETDTGSSSSASAASSSSSSSSDSDSDSDASESSSASGVEPVPGECPVCAYMRAGPCGVEYTAFDTVCVKRESEEMPPECSAHFHTMRSCYQKHTEYYGFILDMFDDALKSDDDEPPADDDEPRTDDDEPPADDDEPRTDDDEPPADDDEPPADGDE